MRSAMLTDDVSSRSSFSSAPLTSQLPAWHSEVPEAVSERVQACRQRALTAANHELVTTYWSVGAEILAPQAAEAWGARVIDRLSHDLRDRFPDAKGFSPRNLSYMRAFAAA